MTLFAEWDRSGIRRRTDQRGTLHWLRWWGAVLDSEFNLGVGRVDVLLDRLGLDRMAQCHGSGRKAVLTFSELYMDRPDWCLLSTHLHELVHAHVGVRHGHDDVFSATMERFGLLVHGDGRHRGVMRDGAFARLLARHGVPITGGLS
jgi:hypothetical protein